MSAPLLDGAIALPDKTERYDLAATVPFGQPPSRSDDEDEADTNTQPQSEEARDRARWLRLGRSGTGSVAAHIGVGGGNQIDLFLIGGVTWGAGIKHQLIDARPWAVAAGVHFYLDTLSFLADEATAGQLSLPLWIGYEPLTWLGFYAAERLQVRGAAGLGVTVAAVQTAGLRVGEGFGVLAEASYVVEPIFDSGGPQIAFALYIVDE